MSGIPQPALCLVTDRHRLAPGAACDLQIETLVRQLREAADAGVDLIHVREPDLPARSLCDLVRRIVTHVRATGGRTRVLVVDRADVASAAGAHGVHLPERGLLATRVRRLDQAWTIGKAAHGDFDAAVGDGADYLVYGPIFATVSKPAVAPAGLAALDAASRRAGRPVLAIGGITPARMAGVMGAGAAGAAAIGVFLPPGRGPDAIGPAAAVQALRQAGAAVAARRVTE